MAQADGLYIGLMSGTSADGIDAALVRFDAAGKPELLAAHSHDWPDTLRARLVALGQGGTLESLEELGTLDVQVGEHFAAAALAVMAKAGVASVDVEAIGSHGQTIRHRPMGAKGDGQHPFTMQIGDGHLIAERTGITTVFDFRRRDVAAGGQGAPLLPALHQALFTDSAADVAVLNLGGIANVTLLPAVGKVHGFDTGPANALMDAWCQTHTGKRFDAGGAWAGSGHVNDALLAQLLADPWFALPPPKSTGREQFHLDWVRAHLPADISAVDVQSTLLALTAQTATAALLANQPDTRQLWVCGGGVHNPVLMDAIRTAMPGICVQSSDECGVDPDHVEAMGFAWLARQTLLGRAGNLPAVTGAVGARVLGCVAMGECRA